MIITKKIFTVLFILSFALVSAFSMDVNKEISRFTPEQQLIINAYKIMLDGEEDSMDAYTSDENDTLIEILSLSDGDFELVESELEAYDLQDNEVEALWLRYLVMNSFPNQPKLDIAVLNDLVGKLHEKGLNKVKTYNAMQNPIVSFVNGINPKNKQKNLESLEVVADLIVKFYDAPKLVNTIGMALQDKSVKGYILTGVSELNVEVTHGSACDTIKDDLNKRFKATLATDSLDIIVSILQAKGMKDEQIIGTVENFLSEFCKDVKNPKAKNKKTQESLEVIASLFNKLASSDNVVNAVALVLNDANIKAYILEN